MTIALVIIATATMPVVIGYAYAVKRGAHHRPEYDRIS
jgi:hypothetical protein